MGYVDRGCYVRRRRGIRGRGGSWNKQKLVRVEECPAQAGEAVLFGQGGGVLALDRIAGPAEGGGGGFVSEPRGIVAAGSTADPRGEALGLVEEKAAVVEIQGLDGGGRATARGRDLPGVGAVEGAEDGVLLHAQLQGIDHAAVVAGAELVLGDPVAGVVRVRLEEEEAGAEHPLIERATDEEHIVADRLGLETAGREAPEPL